MTQARETVYHVGSLRNPDVPKISEGLRELGYDVFDDWFAAGPRADDHWQEYELGRGHTYGEALNGFAAEHVFKFDLHHLNRSTIGLLSLPAGKSGHLELGYLIGQGKPGYVLWPDGMVEQSGFRYDVMYQFAAGRFFSMVDLLAHFGDKQKMTADRILTRAMLQA